MRQCYHSACDSLGHPHLDEKDFEFLSRTTQALVYTLAEMASKDMGGVVGTKCPLKESFHVPDTLFFTPEEEEELEEPAPIAVEEEEVELEDNNIAEEEYEEEPAVVVSEEEEEEDDDPFNIDANFIDDVDFEDNEVSYGQHEDRYDPGADNPDVEYAQHGLYQDDPSFNEIDYHASPTSVRHQGLVLNVVPPAPPLKSYSDQSIKPAVSPPSNWFSSSEDSRPVYHIGTQINIGSLVIGMPNAQNNNVQKQDEGGGGGDFQGPNLVLGSSDVDYQLLANLVQSYFGSQQQQQQEQQQATTYSNPASAQQQINSDVQQQEEEEDRRRNQGKYKSSPMLIKLLNKAWNWKRK